MLQDLAALQIEIFGGAEEVDGGQRGVLSPGKAEDEEEDDSGSEDDPQATATKAATAATAARASLQPPRRADDEGSSGSDAVLRADPEELARVADLIRGLRFSPLQAVRKGRSSIASGAGGESPRVSPRLSGAGVTSPARQQQAKLESGQRYGDVTANFADICGAARREITRRWDRSDYVSPMLVRLHPERAGAVESNLAAFHGLDAWPDIEPENTILSDLFFEQVHIHMCIYIYICIHTYYTHIII